MADMGLQVCNLLAGHAVDITVSEMVPVHFSETVLDHIVEQGTGIVEHEIPVGHSIVLVLVTSDVGSPGVGSGSLTLLIAGSWTYQMAENVVSEAGSLVVHMAGIDGHHVAGNVVQVPIDEGQVTEKI